MAKMRGGIFGRPSGQISDIVIGAARDRQGKVATARVLTIPANPNTAEQQIQRAKFSDSLYVVRNWGPDMYQDDWNRAIGQLPGFQSLMSILLNAISDTYEYSEPPTTPLGTLHWPDTWTVAQGAATDEIDISWSTEPGTNGTSADELQVAAVRVGRNAQDVHPVEFVADAETRTTGAYSLDVGEDNTPFIVASWWQGAGTAEGLLSPADWFEVYSGA